MKDEVKTPVLVVLAVVVLGLVVFFAIKAFNAGNLDQGQVQYTPGVPPWEEKDPNKRGPGAAPPSSQPGAPAQPGQQPTGSAQNQAPTQPGMPVGPPVISNK